MLPTQVLMSWHNGFVSEVVTGNERTKATCFTQSARLCFKNGRVACQASKMNCGLIFSFCCGCVCHKEPPTDRCREAEPHVSPLCLCCKRDGPEIMSCQSDCQHITAVQRYDGVVVLCKTGLCLVTCPLLLQNMRSF